MFSVVTKKKSEARLADAPHSTVVTNDYFTFAVAEPPRLLRTVTVAGFVPEKLNEPS